MPLKYHGACGNWGSCAGIPWADNVGATCGRPLARVSTNPWGATTSARHPPAGMPPGRAAFLKVASRGFSSKAPLAPSTLDPGAHGGGGLCLACRDRACIAARRRCKFQIIRFAASGKAHSFHCISSPHRTRFAGLRRGPRVRLRHRRCRASGGTHRDHPAGPDSRCAVPTWPAGPPSVPCR